MFKYTIGNCFKSKFNDEIEIMDIYEFRKDSPYEIKVSYVTGGFNIRHVDERYLDGLKRWCD